MKTPEQLVTELRALYKEMSTINEDYRYMWDEQLADMEALLGTMIFAHVKYQETDWAKEEQEKHVEDNWDGGRF